MHESSLQAYRCPTTGQQLQVQTEGRALSASGGRLYPVVDGIIDFTESLAMGTSDKEARQLYDLQAGPHYDNAMKWLWEAFYEDEGEVRCVALNLLGLGEAQRVLEIGCGSGSDSELIARRMKGGELFLQDLSPNMLRLCKARLEKIPGLTPQLEYSISVSHPLPFADGYFDRVFHFGGLNMFGDVKAALQEMARVTKPGGRIVVGDESLAPWLRDTEYGRILVNNNHLMEAAAPLDKLPIGARDVSLRFVIGNAFYLIAFTVGDGPPAVNLDLPHKGRRGGTMRTRYFGQLEGVSLEAKRLATAAAAESGKSVHDWLDEAVRQKAATDLGQKED